MHPEWAMYLRVLLTLHISCGVVGFVCAPVALAKAKGGKVHRRFGKIYFWAMAGVAVTALILSVALPVYFLTMVAVFSFYSAFAAVSCSLLEGHVQRCATQGSGLDGCGGNGVVEPAAFPHGFFAAGADARWRGPNSRTHAEHCFHCLRGHRNAHGTGFDPRTHQAIGRKDVLVVWPYARDDRQLHRGDDRFFRGESYALIWPGLVGMAVADDRRRTGDCHLDGVLQEEVFAQAGDRRGVILQTYQSVWPGLPNCASETR
jgi:uncharacterized membrane protein